MFHIHTGQTTRCKNLRIAISLHNSHIDPRFLPERRHSPWAGSWLECRASGPVSPAETTTSRRGTRGRTWRWRGTLLCTDQGACGIDARRCPDFQMSRNPTEQKGKYYVVTVPRVVETGFFFLIQLIWILSDLVTMNNNLLLPKCP